MSRTLARITAPIVLAGVALVSGAAHADDAMSLESEVVGIYGEPGAPGDAPRTLRVGITPAPQPIDSPVQTAAGTIIYMNRDGGTYTVGGNNSSTNRSSIPQQTSVVPPWNVSEAGWQQVMTCVRGLFAPFDVEITDIDPGAAAHYESVVAGSPGDVQMPDNVGGVSPFTTDCSVIDRSIVFTFAEVYGNDYETICEVVGQEVAHSFGLDHQLLASDPMTYLDYNGLKSFKDQTVSCGEFSARDCGLEDFPPCSATQNSFQMLGDTIGIGDAILPTISITSPGDGADVPPGFDVYVAASDDQVVTRVELWIDGALAETLTAAPFVFTTDATIGLGTHVVETRAYDSKNQATTSISVNVEDGAEPPDPEDPGGDPEDPNDPGGNGRPTDLVGGCAAGGSSGAGASLALIGIALCLAGRRRGGRVA